MITVYDYFLYFLLYSFIGWSLEVILKYLDDKKLVNRGFLLGPICPIYGVGVILIILLIGCRDNDLLSIFLKSILICSVLEYATSFIMEKMFKARWWDYSNNRFNINGRICLETMLPFGIGATTVLYFIHPRVIKYASYISPSIKLILFIILLTILIIDIFISMNIMGKIKNQISFAKEDNTAQIKSRVMEWINKNSFWYRRIIRAFPKFRIIERVKSIKNVIIKDPNKSKNDVKK